MKKDLKDEKTEKLQLQNKLKKAVVPMSPASSRAEGEILEPIPLAEPKVERKFKKSGNLSYKSPKSNKNKPAAVTRQVGEAVAERTDTQDTVEEKIDEQSSFFCQILIKTRF